ncbi:DUF6898 family protein [Marinicauda algicola]|uniref:DUF6898 family protein n=1 Tax=Marinicauda algicola TaxID=2029849 RepID=UPI0018643DEC|nr:serine hydroxymethyltransferase [Marinicauda algicola]
MSSKRDPSAGREIIFEFQSVGEAVRVAAIDVETGEEVVIQGPVTTGQEELERVAARKLMRRLEQVSKESDEKKTPPRGGGGVIV